MSECYSDNRTMEFQTVWIAGFGIASGWKEFLRLSQNAKPHASYKNKNRYPRTGKSVWSTIISRPKSLSTLGLEHLSKKLRNFENELPAIVNGIFTIGLLLKFSEAIRKA